LDRATPSRSSAPAQPAAWPRSASHLPPLSGRFRCRYHGNALPCGSSDPVATHGPRAVVAPSVVGLDRLSVSFLTKRARGTAGPAASVLPGPGGCKQAQWTCATSPREALPHFNYVINVPTTTRFVDPPTRHPKLAVPEVTLRLRGQPDRCAEGKRGPHDLHLPPAGR